MALGLIGSTKPLPKLWGKRLTYLNMIGEPFEFLAPDPGPPYRVLAQDKGKVAIVDPAGKVEWEMPLRHTAHDIQLLGLQRQHPRH